MQTLTTPHAPHADTNSRRQTSYSGWNLFRNCRKAAYWRYIEGLRSLDRPEALAQGDAVHQALEAYYAADLDDAAAYRAIDLAIFGESLPDDAAPLHVAMMADELLPCWWHESTPEQRHRWHITTAMLAAYMHRYPSESWRTVSVEADFEGEIVNPATGKHSRSFTLRGRVDGIVKTDDGYFLIEHKTTSRMDGGYLERLWMDMQIQLYSLYFKPDGQQISGVIYNILSKPALRQRDGESEDEFEARKADMKMPARAKRRGPESDRDFQLRLAAWFAADDTRFHRETLYFTPDDLREMRAQLWELTQQWLDAARSRDGAGWYKNTSHCFAWNRPCEFLPLCRSGGAEAIKAAFYARAVQAEDDPTLTPADDPLAF